MITLYAVCAVAGGGVLVLQFLLVFVGMGSHGFESHGAGFEHAAAHGTDTAHSGHDGAHDSSWIFRLLSARALTAALAFFGLGGGLCTSAGLPTPVAFLGAIGLGVGAMLLAVWLMQLLMSLREEGTAHIEYALGQPARVYLSIPGHEQGQGKVIVTVDGRELEYQAITRDEELPTGCSAVVSDIIDEQTVCVKKAH